jgi:hypothetical protein
VQASAAEGGRLRCGSAAERRRPKRWRIQDQKLQSDALRCSINSADPSTYRSGISVRKIRATPNFPNSVPHSCETPSADCQKLNYQRNILPVGHEVESQQQSPALTQRAGRLLIAAALPGSAPKASPSSNGQLSNHSYAASLRRSMSRQWRQRCELRPAPPHPTERNSSRHSG